MFYIGMAIVLFSILAGFAAEGGNLYVLFQPYAALIILGSAIGVLILSNPKSLLKSMWQAILTLSKGSPYTKQDYLQLLCFIFYFFRYTKNKSMLEIETDIENPYKSPIFNEFPGLLNNREALVFFCDYMRMTILGFDKTYEIANLIEEQISIRKNHMYEISQAFYKIGDALPALGIIAAVLGVINAMGSMDADPTVLGHKIGAALIGTFLGIAAAYCIAFPLGASIQKFGDDEAKYLECMRSALISHLNGNIPSISVEFARQNVPVNLKPSYFDVEKAIELHKQKRKLKKYVRREQTATV